MRFALGVGIVVAMFATGLGAGPVERSLHPRARPDPPEVSRAAATDALGPTARPRSEGQGMTNAGVSTSNQRFQNWIGAFKRRAMVQGIDGAVLERAFDDVHYDAQVIRRDRNQSEFTRTIWDYLDSAASDARIANGKKAMRANLATLNAIEARYGVDKQVLVAIWGLESAYGSFRGSNNVVQSLATLAFDTRRAAFFEGQLMAALRILQNGDVSPENMTGSWAGAMGHTQFMPTSYLDSAVDFTGDGKRDIWSDDPTDALASTAAYLAKAGWTRGQPWGVEVTLPHDFDYRLANRKIMKNPSDWARIGVLGVDGRPVRDYGKASVLLPAGGDGAAFMIFDNFAVIEHYNTADAYVIGVGHLGDRIMGGAPIRADWPRSDRALTLKERKELQQRLTEAGFDTRKIDGRIGPLTINAVRAYQVASGLVPDGYASLRLLKRLR